MERMMQSKYYLREERKEREGSDIAEDCASNGDVYIMSDSIHVNDLSVEMLGMIFSYLTPTELARSVLPVCKYWNDVSNALFLWRHLKFGPRGSTEDVVRVVAKSTLLKSIELHNRNDFEPILRAIYKNSKKNKTKVEEISLKVGPPHGSSKVEGFLVGTQYRTCCDSPTCFPNSLEDGMVKVPCSTQMMVFCPHLKKLTLSNAIIRSKLFYDRIGTTLRSLTQLTLVRCHHFTPANLHSIADNCTRLSHVTILQTVPEPHSSSDAIATVWDLAYQALLKKRGALLQVLEFGAEYLEDSTYQALSASTKLHTLSLENGKHLASKGISAISTLECLKHLHIFKSYLCLDRRSIGQLLAPGNLANLETLAIPNCTTFDNNCMDMVTLACPNLSTVNISHLPQITDRGITFLFERCIKLRHLNLHEVFNFSGESLKLVPQSTPSLRELVVDTVCEVKTEKCIQELIARFPEIQIKREA